MKDESSYHLSPKGLLGETAHNDLREYMNTLKKTWKLQKHQAMAVMLSPDGEQLVFCAFNMGAPE